MLALGDFQRLLGQLEKAASIAQLGELVDQRQVLQQLGASTQFFLALAHHLLGAMLVDRDLDRTAQLVFLERLDRDNPSDRSAPRAVTSRCRDDR